VAVEILDMFENKIRSLTLTPGLNGVFEITLNERQIFSKKDTGEFPEPGAISRLIEERAL
jgi:selenoprotein W-related protein